MAFNERLAFLIQQVGGERVVRALDDITKAAQRAGKATTSANEDLEKKASLADRALAKLGLTGKVTAGELKAGVATGAAVAGAAVAKFLVDAADKSSALQEQVSAAQVTFGKAADGLVAWAEKADTSLGLSERSALQAANAFGNFFKNVGIGDQASAELSQGLVQLAGDLASFKDLDPGDVLQKLRSGLAGESEPLRDLGIFLDETKVKAKAMELNLGGAHGELSDGAKILARYQIIIDKTTDAQGDLARTSASLANQQRRQAAQFENFQASIGKVALPALAGITAGTNDFIAVAEKGATAIGGLESVVNTAGEALVKSIPGIREWTAAGELFGVTADDNTDKAKSLAESLAVYHDLVVSGEGDESALAAARRDVKEAADDELAVQKALTDAMGDGADATKEAAEALERYDRSLRERSDAITDLPRAQRDLSDAVADVADAEKALVEARTAGPDPDDVADAEDDLRSARLSVSDATDQLSDAQARLNELRREAPDPLEMARKELAAQEARLGEKKAATELREAQEELDRTRRSGAGSDYVEEAEQKVEEAQLKVADASLDTKEAQKELDEARRGSTTRARELERAERDVERAALGVREARRREHEAEENLNKIRNPDRVRAIRDAENELAAAIERAESASRRLADDQAKIAGTAAQTGYTLIQAQIAALATLLGLLPAGPARDSIQAAIDQLKPLLQPSDTLISKKGGARAAGGPVWPGTWLVGEQGPELVHIGGAAGTVSNASDTRRMLGGGVQRVFNFAGATFHVADLTDLIRQAEDLDALSNLTFGVGSRTQAA